MKKGLKEFFYEEDGIGTVEMILILVVLIMLVTIFKKELKSLVESLFEKVGERANKL